jgi:XTP/dITP diphosphohydrolase
MTERSLPAWVLATHNPGKVEELRMLLSDCPVSLRTAGALDLPEPEETGTTYEANAALKAVAAATAAGLPALSDDSGVEAHALGGDPGVYTADWAGPERDFSIARERVKDALDALGPGASRRATYVCALCLAWPDGRVQLFRGNAGGELVWPIRGELGHGFEPMFLPDGYAITYGEMKPEYRLRVNARAQAMRKLREALFNPVSDGT